MASYIEIRNLMNDSELRNRIQASVAICAHEVMLDAAGFPSSTVDTQLQSDRLDWAARAINNPAGEAQKVMQSVLAGARAFTVAQIQAAPDEGANSILDATKLVVDLLAQHDKPAV